ncbi:MAG TPA: DUF5335 family protein [Tepidisphaeraceae bacterium]|nr:DUF5335 family protein [Tepidisphaeraceae bacterium]
MNNDVLKTRTIPEQEWVDFSQQFTQDHLDWPATIEVLAGENGPQIVANELPFQGISFDTKGSRPNALSISAGQPGSNHVTHTVDLPLYIREADRPDGQVDLQIEPARGSVTLVHLHGPSLQ